MNKTGDQRKNRGNAADKLADGQYLLSFFSNPCFSGKIV
jgi:hypothetical protein